MPTQRHTHTNTHTLTLANIQTHICMHACVHIHTLHTHQMHLCTHTNTHGQTMYQVVCTNNTLTHTPNRHMQTKQEQKGAKSTKKEILLLCCCHFLCSWSFVSTATALTTTTTGISNLPLAQRPASCPACCWGWSQQWQGVSLLSVGCRWLPSPPGSLTLHLPSHSVWSSPVCEGPEADCSHQVFQTIPKTWEVHGVRNVFFNNR